MSRSESPSITNFFKPARKRPRGSVGKDEVVMSASKKLLLEQGIGGGGGGGSGGADLEDDPGFVKPKLVVVPDKPVGSVKTVKTEKVKKGSSKTRKTAKTGETKITGFVKSTKTTQSLEEGSKNCDPDPPPPADSVKEKVNENVGEEQQPLPPQEPPVELEEKQKKEEEPAKAMEEKTNEPSSSMAAPASPVKFLKVGSLSPAKRKMMNSEQVARLLKKKTKLNDLKSALAGINQCAERLTEFRRTVAEKSVMMSPSKTQSVEQSSTSSSASKRMAVPSAQFYSPTPADRLKSDLERLSDTKNPSPSKLVNVNNKIKKRLFEEQGSKHEGKEHKAPAYQRLHSLAQKTPAERGPGEEVELPLPYHFKILKELFSAVDTVLGIMKGRKETILFPKVKAGVVELFKRENLREKHLAQMATVLPNCYQFDVVKVGNEYHYKIDVEDLLPSVRVARLKAFHANLIKICLEEHQKFLLGLVPPIVVPKDKQITRWHAQFKLDKTPDITPHENALPEKPTPDKIPTAREVMAKAQTILQHANPRMRLAMESMLNADQQPEKSKNVAVPQKPKAAEKMKALKGVSASLLEKIRNREKEKAIQEITRSPAESKKLQMAKALPKYVKVIRNLMLVEKKVALPMETMVERVTHSIQGKSEVETEEHLRLLATLVPNWAKLVKISRSDVEYFRVDMKKDINNLLQEMDEIIKKLT